MLAIEVHWTVLQQVQLYSLATAATGPKELSLGLIMIYLVDLLSQHPNPPAYDLCRCVYLSSVGIPFLLPHPFHVLLQVTGSLPATR